jgi:hypothetical protein
MSRLNSISFDQIVSGDVKITKKCGKKTFKIVFNKISDFLLYQVWSNQTPNFNNNRNVLYIKPKDWITANLPNPPVNNPPFQPTCVMELDFSNRYVFIINKAKIKNDKVVFTVSVKDINLVNPTGNMNLLTEIPQGSFLNVRFDIDITNPTIISIGQYIPPYTYSVQLTPLNNDLNNDLYQVVFYSFIDSLNPTSPVIFQSSLSDPTGSNYITFTTQTNLNLTACQNYLQSLYNLLSKMLSNSGITPTTSYLTLNIDPTDYTKNNIQIAGVLNNGSQNNGV